MEMSNPEKYGNFLQAILAVRIYLLQKGLFFDFFLFSLKNDFHNGSETLILWQYIQFVIEWYNQMSIYEKNLIIQIFFTKKFQIVSWISRCCLNIVICVIWINVKIANKSCLNS